LENLRVGFIGSGFIARFFVDAWTGVRGADITAICNPNVESARVLSSYAEGLGLGRPRVYAGIHEMLSGGAVDAVWILSPNYARLEAAKAVAEEAAQGRRDIVGVCCEKPLGRNADEAEEMVRLVEGAGLLHGYLENQVFAPSVVRGRDAAWRHGARSAGRPYLARAAEEHGGPHRPWFWDPRRSGGGVLLDMVCHSLEVDRFLLSDPERPRNALRPVSVQGSTASLKWTREPYLSKLKTDYGVDYSVAPAEDYASVTVAYEDEDGSMALSEAKTSWCYVGPGLRLTLELLGPEYSVAVNSLQQELNVFLSRNVEAPPSEEFVEKQAAEQGLMPVVPDEAAAYGYLAETRHMADSFRRGVEPAETWRDGLLIARLMMAGYRSAEEGRTIGFSPEALRGYMPKVAQGKWRP